MAKRRNVQEEEAALWRLVVRDVVPLHSSASQPDEIPPEGEEKPVQAEVLPKAVSKPPKPVQSRRSAVRRGKPVSTDALPERRITPSVPMSDGGEVYRVDAPEQSFAEMMARTTRRLSQRRATRVITPKVGVRGPGLDDTSWRRLTKGTLKVDAKLDLHGYIVQDAFERLLDFLQRARSQNLKCIEVVTGLGSGDNSGAIRRELPLWLQRADIRGAILAVVHTHKANQGAVRILLKTRR
ncbi:DNA mismatch repair protein MutS [Neokomagataea tanensis]|uniref:DNA mismatch repair protein MutS n=1 Tax=Neokomagataea tanensis TaxID=661191 RepID=A0A4Y6V707_9PROT|nr:MULTISPECIES: Smr/MutS family protein [Neokomagataea]QDH25164.1 DNA mismatch repair protein MutS [Neokomagataea tanensis]